MKSLRRQIKATIGFSGLALLAGLATHLALTDIYHGETNVDLEWNIVRASALVLLLFLGMAVCTLARVLRAVK